MSQSYHILIIDDEELLTDMLSEHFRRKGYLVWAANNRKEAMEHLSAEPDIVLLDINMPDMDGLEFCRQIREHINGPIIFLTARVEEADKISGFMAGGDDYVTKPFSLEELTVRVDAHLRREQRRTGRANVFTAGDIIINLSEQTVYYGDTPLSFSRTEFDLISYLAQHAGYVLDRERIYEAVWGYDAQGDSSVIKEHISKIRTKLKKAAGKDYIETIWGMGYRWTN